MKTASGIREMWILWPFLKHKIACVCVCVRGGGCLNINSMSPTPEGTCRSTRSHTSHQQSHSGTLSHQCSQLCTSVCKWCIDFDFDIHNFHLQSHLEAQFFCCCCFLKLVNRKLHSSEVQSDLSLVQSSWANNIVSWQEYLPLPKSKVCMRAWRQQQVFKMSYFVG